VENSVSYALDFYIVRSIYQQGVLLIPVPVAVSVLCPGQRSKCKKQKKAITPKLDKAE